MDGVRVELTHKILLIVSRPKRTARRTSGLLIKAAGAVEGRSLLPLIYFAGAVRGRRDGCGLGGQIVAPRLLVFSIESSSSASRIPRSEGSEVGDAKHNRFVVEDKSSSEESLKSTPSSSCLLECSIISSVQANRQSASSISNGNNRGRDIYFGRGESSRRERRTICLIQAVTLASRGCRELSLLIRERRIEHEAWLKRRFLEKRKPTMIAL